MNKCDVMERAVNKGKEEVREEERINSIKVLRNQAGILGNLLPSSSRLSFHVIL